MAVATKVAALGVFLRFFDVALIGAQSSWGPAVATLATITIIVGNVGALGQSSLKRMLAYSSVAQAGYMLAGVVVATQLGRARHRLLPRRLPVHEHGRLRGDHRARARDRPRRRASARWPGLGRERPLLAWPLTIAMLGLAGIPATAGFIGKFYLIDAAVSGGYTWLGDRDRGRLDDLARLLPAGDRRDVDARGALQARRRGAPVSPRPPRGRCRRSPAARPELDARDALPIRPGVGTPARGASSSPCSPAPPRSSSGSSPQPLFDLVRHVGSGLGLF